MSTVFIVLHRDNANSGEIILNVGEISSVVGNERSGCTAVTMKNGDHFEPWESAQTVRRLMTEAAAKATGSE